MFWINSVNYAIADGDLKIFPKSFIPYKGHSHMAGDLGFYNTLYRVRQLQSVFSFNTFKWNLLKQVEFWSRVNFWSSYMYIVPTFWGRLHFLFSVTVLYALLWENSHLECMQESVICKPCFRYTVWFLDWYTC